jgi:hypothetical protein
VQNAAREEEDVTSASPTTVLLSSIRKKTATDPSLQSVVAAADFFDLARVTVL